MNVPHGGIDRFQLCFNQVAVAVAARDRVSGNECGAIVSSDNRSRLQCAVKGSKDICVVISRRCWRVSWPNEPRAKGKENSRCNKQHPASSSADVVATHHPFALLYSAYFTQGNAKCKIVANPARYPQGMCSVGQNGGRQAGKRAASLPVTSTRWFPLFCKSEMVFSLQRVTYSHSSARRSDGTPELVTNFHASVPTSTSSPRDEAKNFNHGAHTIFSFPHLVRMCYRTW